MTNINKKSQPKTKSQTIVEKEILIPTKVVLDYKTINNIEKR